MLVEAVLGVSSYSGVVLAVFQDYVKTPCRHRSRASLASLGIDSHRLSSLEEVSGRPVEPA